MIVYELKLPVIVSCSMKYEMCKMDVQKANQLTITLSVRFEQIRSYATLFLSINIIIIVQTQVLRKSDKKNYINEPEFIWYTQ